MGTDREVGVSRTVAYRPGAAAPSGRYLRVRRSAFSASLTDSGPTSTGARAIATFSPRTINAPASRSSDTRSGKLDAASPARSVARAASVLLPAEKPDQRIASRRNPG